MDKRSYYLNIYKESDNGEGFQDDNIANIWFGLTDKQYEELEKELTAIVKKYNGDYYYD